MASSSLVNELPCDIEGFCMVCKVKAEKETVACMTCTTPWHVPCLRSPPKTLAEETSWVCPDCSGVGLEVAAAAAAPVGGGGELVDKIRAIEGDATLSEAEKARKRQELLSGGGNKDDVGDDKKKSNGGVLGLLDDKFNCTICMQLLERPVSTPCGHNFCLKCFQKWVGQQGKKTCAMCREPIPAKMAAEPRINSAIVMAIRMAKNSESDSPCNAPKIYHFIHNQDRPDKAFTTERAKKSGIANACSGKIFVTIPLDHFGPITAEYDPVRNQGVLVGETWRDRMECRQWGAHFSHVAGINGQSNYGAQSVALSGGYEDDEDHGDWFLYTGSGGRDLSGNKRTNKYQSFDQKFTKSNEALRVSCRNGYPVRVVRSHKEKRSSYAPAEGVRYDGVYRIEKCWRKVGIQGFKVCRYLFVRCDNEPAPWTSDNHGDRPRPSLPRIEELKNATDVFDRKGSPSWDFDKDQGRWIWKKPPPESCKTTVEDIDGGKKRKRKNGKGSVKERLLKEFSCLKCRKVMVLPLSTPCAHNFCKACLEGTFAGQAFVKERTRGGRTLRAQKNVMKCPSCQNDITEFLQNPQVNRELQNVIESLQTKMKEEAEENKDPYGEEGDDESGDEAPDVDEQENSNDGDESSEAAGDDKENCDVNAEPILERGKDSLKDSADKPDAVNGGDVKNDKPRRNAKRKKTSNEAGVLVLDAANE